MDPESPPIPERGLLTPSLDVPLQLRVLEAATMAIHMVEAGDIVGLGA
jgi:hypothetical protein